jgi:ribosomal protein S18 acetylase RimI-like enzyme
MAKADDLVIKPAGKQKEIDEARKFASTTGSEEDEINEMMKHDKVYLAQKHGSTIGFLALRRMKNGEVTEISGLAIAQSERRRGNASQLVKHAQQLARTMKANRVIVRTSNDNVPALALYQKLGFRIAEVKLGALAEHHGTETPGWEGIPVRDEIILEKSLS